MRNIWVLIAALLLSATLSEGGVVERHQQEQPSVLNVDAIEDDSKDQIPVAVIEVQEPETALQSLQVDTAIQTTDNSAAESEQPTIDEKDEVNAAETATYADAVELEKRLGLTEIISDNLKTETPEIIKTDPLVEQPKTISAFDKLAEKAVTDAPTILTETVQALSLDQAPSAVVPAQSVIIEEMQQNVPVAASEPEAAVRQAIPATPVQSTTPQNFVQFIQASPIGQFFSQLTGGQQQPQQPAGATPAGVASDEPAVTPSVPGFLNPATALTQAQQAVQSAAQTVVNSTSQAFQGLQQFASNIGNQFQNTLSSLSGQNQLSNPEASSVRPPGPIQSLVNNLVGGTQGINAATTPAPGQQQGPLQANKPPKNDENNQAVTSPLDDKIDGQSEADATNEVRNSEENVDSFEEPHSGPLIVVNDDPSTITGHDSNV